MRLIRLICAVYCLILTVLLLVPDPLALLGIERPPGPSGGGGVHFVFFTVLAFLILASRFPVRRGLLAGILLTYALTTESLQWFIPIRTVEQQDYVENLLGLAAGAALWWMVRKTRQDRGTAAESNCGSLQQDSDGRTSAASEQPSAIEER